jgi:hypothetical protein
VSHKQKFSTAGRGTPQSVDRRKPGGLARGSKARKSKSGQALGAWISRHPRLVIGIILMACLGPFVNKAIHTDDALFVWAGQWIQKHPADFFGGQVNWWKSAIPMWVANYNPPLVSYFLAGVAGLFGWSEIVLHLACLAVAYLAALGVYSLARMWCQRPLLATVIAIFTPAFLVSSTTLMCDVMMLGFWIWALVLWERALGGERSVWQFIGAGALAGLAVLTKYSAIDLLPLLLLLGVLRTRKPGWWLLGLAVPVLMLGGYELVTMRMYGRGLFSAAVRYAHTTHINFPGGWRASAIVDLAFAGGSVMPLLFFAPWLWRRRTWLAGGILMLGGLLVTFQLWDHVVLNGAAPDLLRHWDFLVQAVLLTAGGLHLLLLVAAETWRRRDIVTLTLVLWITGTIYFATVLNWTVNVRSFLPLVPAVAILLVRRLETFRGNLTLGSRWLWPLIPAAAIALGVATADYQLAGLARTAATQITAKYKSANHTIWFEGHGAFQYYMEKLGGQPVDVTGSFLQPADVVVIPEVGDMVELPPGGVGWGEHFECTPAIWMKLMGGDEGGLAGFHGANFGPLPFIFGRPSPQPYDIVRVFLRMHYNSKPANQPEMPAGAVPDFPHISCEVENKAVPPINSESLNQTQAAGRLAAEGKMEEAVQACREALNLEADNPEALSRLAWILTTADSPELRNGGEAVQLATRAVVLTDYRRPQLIQVLAAAYAEAGRFPAAIEMTQISRVMAVITGQKDIIESNRRLLGLYAAGKSLAAFKLAGGVVPVVPDAGNLLR